MADIQTYKKLDNNSILSEASSHSLKSVWKRLSHLFHHNSTNTDYTNCTSGNKRRYSTLSNTSGTSSQHNKCVSMTDSTTTCSSLSSSSTSSSNNSSNSSSGNVSRGRQRKVLMHNSRLRQQQRQELLPATSNMIIPPFSPTYCKPNEFPYSNFYVKLPNGKWMVRYRSGNRDILGTDEFEGYLI